VLSVWLVRLVCGSVLAGMVTLLVMHLLGFDAGLCELGLHDWKNDPRAKDECGDPVKRYCPRCWRQQQRFEDSYARGGHGPWRRVQGR
jgi:predicted amidophosphoribosyltransferase